MTFCSAFGQTVEFKKSDQNISLSEKTINLSLQVKDYKPEKDELPFIIELHPNLNDKEIFPDLQNGKFDIPINPFYNEGIVQVKLKWVPDKIKDSTYISFRLRKNDEKDQRFQVSDKGHIIFLKKKEKLSISLGITNSCCEKINANFLNDSKILFNYAIVADEPGLTVNDKQEIIIGFVGVSDVKKTFKVEYNPNSPMVKDSITLKDNKEDFERVKNWILKNRKIELEIKEIKKNEKFNLKVDDNKKKVTYNYHYKGLQNKYNIFLGSNFDIQEEFSTSKFFAEINVFLPNVLNKYGLRGGIYKNNTSTEYEESRTDQTIYSQVESTTDSITYNLKRVRSTPKVEIENLGLFVEGLYSLKKTDNFNFFLGFHVEIIQRVEKYTFQNEDLITLETNTISLDSLASNSELIGLLNRPNTFTNKYVDSYFGLSLPTFYHHEGQNGRSLEVMINPSLGVGQPGLLFNRGNPNQISLYGFTQFHLIFGSEKGLKFKIGGEARKYFNFDQAPIITVNLSAAINLEELFKTSGG